MGITLQSIIKARKLQKLEVPEFGPGLEVYVRGMIVRERDAFVLACKADSGDLVKVTQARLDMVAACCCNDDGSPIFQGPEEVQQVSGAGVERIATAIHALSGFGGDAEKKA